MTERLTLKDVKWQVRRVLKLTTEPMSVNTIFSYFQLSEVPVYKFMIQSALNEMESVSCYKNSENKLMYLHDPKGVLVEKYKKTKPKTHTLR